MKKLYLVFICLVLIPLSELSAQSVDLLYQGNGYTAPLYKGASLWPKQGLMTVLAVPQGLGNPATLDYIWIKNGTVLGGEGGASGVGKNSLKFSDTLFSKPVTIRVEIVSANDELLAENTLVLTPQDPFVAVYENHPLYGFMFHREVSGIFNLEDKEVTFDAFPFFFDTASRLSQSLSYRWSTNIGESQSGPSVTYRTPEEGGGSSSVSITVAAPEKILPAVSESFLVQFGE